MTEPKLPPPLRKPTSEYPTPSPVVGFFTEIVDRTDQAYQKNAPVKRGTLYSTINGAKQNVIDAYPLLYFVREQKYGNSDQLCIWIWSTAFDAESSYNAEVDYIGDAVACPAFSRVYNVRRDIYEASPTINPGTNLTAIVGVRITAGGTGYTQATGVVGTGAKVQFVIDPAGAIISGIVTVEGSAVTTGQAITITGDGSGATATAIVQPVGAVLTSQKKQELPQDDPLRNEFVRVIRVYELLPGPYIPANRYDPNLGVITGRRRAVLNSSQAATVTNAHSLRYEGREGSSVVSWEIEESWDNTSFPLLKTHFNDPERGPVFHSAQLTTDTTTAGSSVVSGGTSVITTRYEAFPENTNLRQKIIETWTVPRTLNGKELTSEYGGGELAVTQVRGASGQALDSGILVVASKVDPKGDATDEKISKTAVDSWPTLYGTEFDSRFGVLVQVNKTVVAAGTTGSAGTLAVTEIQPLDKWRSIRLIGSIAALPDNQVWHGTRNHSFPDELLDFTLAGTEQLEVIFNIRDGYSGPCKAKFTRSFGIGPPSAQPEPTIFRPQSYSQFVEYQATRVHSQSSINSSISDDTRTSSGTSSDTHESTHNDSSQSVNNSTSNNTHNGDEQTTSTGTETSTHDSNSTNNSIRNGTSSNNGNASSDANLQRFEDEEGQRDTFGITNIITDYHNTSNLQAHSVNNSTSSSSDTSSGTSNSEDTSVGTNVGSSESVRSGTNISSSTGTSETHSDQSSSGSSSGTSSGTSQDSRTGHSTGSSTGESTITTTALSILQVNVPKTLRAGMSASALGVSVVIPATTPTALPHATWITVDSQSEHWKFGVWVTETIEIYVP